MYVCTCLTMQRMGVIMYKYERVLERESIKIKKNDDFATDSST